MAFALNGEGELWDAVTNGDVQGVQRLLRQKADPNIANNNDDSEKVPKEESVCRTKTKAKARRCDLVWVVGLCQQAFRRRMAAWM